MHTYTITIIPKQEFIKTLQFRIVQNCVQTIHQNNYEIIEVSQEKNVHIFKVKIFRIYCKRYYLEEHSIVVSFFEVTRI